MSTPEDRQVAQDLIALLRQNPAVRVDGDRASVLLNGRYEPLSQNGPVVLGQSLVRDRRTREQPQEVSVLVGGVLLGRSADGNGQDGRLQQIWVSEDGRPADLIFEIETPSEPGVVLPWTGSTFRPPTGIVSFVLHYQSRPGLTVFHLSPGTLAASGTNWVRLNQTLTQYLVNYRGSAVVDESLVDVIPSVSGAYRGPFRNVGVLNLGAGFFEKITISYNFVDPEPPDFWGRENEVCIHQLHRNGSPIATETVTPANLEEGEDRARVFDGFFVSPSRFERKISTGALNLTFNSVGQTSQIYYSRNGQSSVAGLTYYGSEPPIDSGLHYARGVFSATSTVEFPLGQGVGVSWQGTRAEFVLINGENQIVKSPRTFSVASGFGAEGTSQEFPSPFHPLPLGYTLNSGRMNTAYRFLQT